MILTRERILSLVCESLSSSILDTCNIQIEDIVLEVEIASTETSRNLGLMFRKSIPRNKGMIFVFPDEDHRSFWMKNTLIPLSIAFADSSGRILNIENLYPGDLVSKHSAGPSKYAIEVNQGDFFKNKILPGSMIKNLPI